MRELSHETLEEFGLTVQHSSREFGAYLCETEAGLYLVKSVDNSERELRLAHQVKTHLRQRGLTQTDAYMLTREGQPWLNQNREILTVRHWIRGNEAELAKPEVYRELGRVLGTLHTCCTGLELPEGIEAAHRYGELPDRLERQLRRVRFMGKNIRRRGRLEEFELMFLQVLRCCEDSAREALEGLRSGCAEENARWAEEERMFCHNAFSNHSVLFGKDGYLIHDFEAVQLAEPVMDLARMMEKLLRKNGWRTEPAWELLSAYEEARTLRPYERKVLYYYLLYPKRVLELAAEGYEKRSWKVPAQYRNKLQEFLEQCEERRRSLEQLKMNLL